jgi:disulfide bond formation protein DsbB
MFRISDLPDTILLWNPETYTLMIIHCIIAGIGMWGSFVVLLSHLGDKLQPNMLPILSLIMADFIATSTTVIMDSINLARGGFAIGKSGCVWLAVIVPLCCFASVLSILACALERYFQIIHQRSVTSREAWVMIVVIWFVSMVGNWFPTFFGAQDKAYGLNSGLTVCTIAWWDGGAWATSSTVLALVTFLSCLFGMGYCYFQIVGTYCSYSQQLVKQMLTIESKANSSELVQSESPVEDVADPPTEKTPQREEPNSHNRKELLFQKERVLLTKALVLTLTFLLLWSPYFIKLWIELITRRPVSPLFDNLCIMGAATNSSVNWILLMALDHRVKRRVYRLFGK